MDKLILENQLAIMRALCVGEARETTWAWSDLQTRIAATEAALRACPEPMTDAELPGRGELGGLSPHPSGVVVSMTLAGDWFHPDGTRCYAPADKITMTDPESDERA